MPKGENITASNLAKLLPAAERGDQERVVIPQLRPVVQIMDESNREIVYTIRIKGSEFRPKVFAYGTDTIHVDKGTNKITMTGIEALAPENPKMILVTEANVSGPDGQPDDRVDLYDFAKLTEDW